MTWSGSTRPALKNQAVHPPLGRPLRAWIGVGGTPELVMRAVRYDLPMMLAVIGGPAVRFLFLVDLYRRAAAEAGHAAQPVGVHSPGHVADSDEAAKEDLWPHHKRLLDRIGRERGWSPISRDHFEAEVAQGALYVGSPETVARKIAGTAKALGLARFELKYSSSG